MGLAWQQGPLAPGAIGAFLTPEPLPERLLYAEPLRRRMRVMFGAGAGRNHRDTRGKRAQSTAKGPRIESHSVSRSVKRVQGIVAATLGEAWDGEKTGPPPLTVRVFG